ncbi:MAG: CooT family nickel-binding protein [Desulfobacteraceae bacterium]|jgi:predicted RNA-binding protein
MCEANVYIDNDGKEELVLESVDVVEPQENGWFRLVSIFGEQKMLSGTLKVMNLVDHKIIFSTQKTAQG